MNTQGIEAQGPDVTLCDLPYPYRAMLSLCSDLDETPSAETYFATSKYLNSSDLTAFGRGVGLEVGNTIYFFMNKNDFSYWNSSEAVQSMIRELVQSGHIDCIHSFGDTAVERSQVQGTLEHLVTHNCFLRVWIDHAVAPTNFGADIMQGQGDVTGSRAYHSDISLQYGIQYVWRGRVTSIQGQDAPLGVGGIWSREEPIGSVATVAKEAAKIMAGSMGSQKYRMHYDNKLQRKTKLRDSRQVIEFLRTNPHPLGISVGDNATGLESAISDRFLDRLVANSAKAIVYTHMGKQIDPMTGFPNATRTTLQKLADRVRCGQLLVTTTARMLDYTTLHENLSWNVVKSKDAIRIEIFSTAGAISYDGLSFKVPQNVECDLVVEGKTLETQRFDIPNEEGSVISVPWRKLQYAA